MIKILLKSYKSDNRGSAIITGLVVSTVLMVLCLSLLLVSYSLFISSSKESSELANREYLYSAAEVFEKEIFSSVLDTSNIDFENPNNISEYIYINLENNNWPSFNGSNIEEASKYFNLTSTGNTKIIVQLYWENANVSDPSNSKNGILLNAIYKLYDNRGNVLIQTSRKYILNIKTTSNGNNQSIVEAEGIEPNFDPSPYNGGYNATITLTNNTEEDYENWMLLLYTHDTITWAWNVGSCVPFGDGCYFITCAANNQDIAPHESIDFGFQCSNSFTSEPEIVVVSPQYTLVDKNDYEIDYPSIYPWENPWGSGTYNINIVMRIKNTSENTIRDWRIRFSLNNEIDEQSLNSNNMAEILTHEGNEYLIRNKVNREGSNLAPNGGSTSFAFKTIGTDENDLPTNISLYQLTLGATNTGTGEEQPSSLSWQWTRIGDEIINPEVPDGT